MVRIEITQEAIEWFSNAYGDDDDIATETVQNIIGLCRISATDDEKKKLLDFDDEVKFILGFPNFACYGIANALRKSGQKIEPDAKAEQAHSIYWMLEMYLMHGKNWRKACDEFFRQVESK